MEWIPVNGIADFPELFKPVLVSNGERTGVAFVNGAYCDGEKIDVERARINGFREDGWTMVLPVDPDHEFKIIKYQPFPNP